ncbi:MAG TPA: GldG family protein [Ruminococcus flavefaciens]|nr:GldG family protein [Ruminococcus flavefaciens]
MSKKDLNKAKTAAEETVKEAAETAAEVVSDAKEEAAEVAEKAVKAAAPKVKGGAKKFKYGSMSAVIVALVLAIVVIVNLMASMLAKRYPIKVDFTPDKRYELSDESIEVLKNINSDVEVTVAMEKELFANMATYYHNYYAQYGINADVPYDMIPNLLEKYSMYAEQGKGSVKVKYVNLDKDPDVVTKYKQYYNGDIEDGSIIVYSNEKVKVIPQADVMNMIQADQASLQSGTPNFVFAGESLITSAIRNVTSGSSIKAGFITTMNGQPVYNQNEYGATVDSFKTSLLEKNGYDCTDIDITTDELKAEDYDLIVLPAPSVDFTENLVEKLSDFLYNDGKYGKNLIYMPSVNTTNLTNIDAFLADWNLQVENKYIIDDKNAIGNTAYIMLNIDDAEAVGTLPSQTLPIIAPVSREITILSKNNENLVKPILSSYDNSFISDMMTQKVDDKNRGKHTVVAMSTKEHAEQYDVYRSSVLVMGSALMADSEFLTQTNTYNNANALLGLINNMTGKEAAAVIPEKSLQQSYIATTQTQAKVIRIIVQWVIPALVAIAGIIVLLRRKNK